MIVIKTFIKSSRCLCNRYFDKAYKINIFRREYTVDHSYQTQDSALVVIARDNKKTDISTSCSSDELITYDKENNNELENKLLVQNEDLSHVTPYVSDTFNFAAYVNKSPSLQNLVELGVNLSAIEKKPFLVEKFLRLDFDKDMKQHIFFLSDYVPSEHIGQFITKNPMIFYESLDDLQVRINYLLSKKFTTDEICGIIQRNPFWLMFSTIRIDKRLGYFQKNFHLIGEEVRRLAVRLPKLITYNLHHINTNLFTIKEEMGFDKDEIKALILNKPKIWMLHQLVLITRFNYIHNTMKVPHKFIVQYPGVLSCRLFRLQQRHLFLEKLGRAQYDPKEANYVPIIALAEGTDVEFCRKYAKCTVDDFNVFLKTL